MSSIKYLLSSFGLCAVIYLSVIAKTHSSTYEEFWDNANLYKSHEGNYVKLSGRLHIDSAWFDSSQGDFSDMNWRRFRFGFKSEYQGFTGALEADINLNNSPSDMYNRLTDANISYDINNHLSLKVLKQSTGFTLDGRTSSKSLLTPQRNNLTNNIWFTDEYFSGISAKGNISSTLKYKAGIFSSDDSDEIGFSEASYFTLVNINTSLDKSTWWEGGNINFDYVYNDVHEDGGTAKLSSIYNMSGQLDFNSWQLAHDLSYAKGDLGQSDLWGVVIMPSYQHSQLLQWVFRYTYLSSNDLNGLKLGRYENKIVSDKGDEYQELYAGANWYLYQHKLKLQLGLQYADMKDKANDGGEYQGWGVTLALRSYW